LGEKKGPECRKKVVQQKDAEQKGEKYRKRHQADPKKGKREETTNLGEKNVYYLRTTPQRKEKEEKDKHATKGLVLDRARRSRRGWLGGTGKSKEGLVGNS